MKHLRILAIILAVARATPDKQSNPLGIDVSGYQPNINWTTVATNGIQFAFIKATEGTSYISHTFNSQYTGAAEVGIIRGAYHFAHPDSSSGADQAKYFLKHGGGWSADGITLPGALDIEYNPSGAECYGLTVSEMVTWIQDFSSTYEAATGRYPGDSSSDCAPLLVDTITAVIYTTTNWWTTCTGNSPAFAANPLWIADWSSTLGPLPAGWEHASFWQYADSGPNPGDADLWNGDYASLELMALGS